MVTSVNHGHLSGHPFTSWALAAHRHVLIAMIAMVHDCRFNLTHIHLTHRTLARLHRCHVAVSAGINGLGFAHWHFGLGRLRKHRSEGQ